MGDPEGILVVNFGTPPGWENQKDFWLENENVKRSVKRTGPGLVNVWNGC